MSRRPRFTRSVAVALVLAWLTGCSTFAREPQTTTPQPTATLLPGEAQVAVVPAATSTRVPTVEPATIPTMIPPLTPTPASTWLTGEVRVFPGPQHYVGDLLTVEVGGYNFDRLPDGQPPQLLRDGEPFPVEPFAVTSPLRESALVFRWAWDTRTQQPGTYSLEVVIPQANGPEERVSFLVNLQPANRRPSREAEVEWQSRVTLYAQVRYLAPSAASRDIDALGTAVDDAFRDVADVLRIRIPGQPVPVTFIDSIWGHGGYTGREMVVSYVDRPYTGLDLDTTLRHEAVHWAMRPTATAETPSLLSEGLAVYVAGGHYKPEPLLERAAALDSLGLYVPLPELANTFWAQQHEVAYLEAGAFTAYLIETYGLDRFFELYQLTGVSADRPSGWLDAAVQRVYDVGLTELEGEFLEDLGERVPGAQAEDVRLTVGLYDAIRLYEALYAPYQEALPDAQEALAAGQTAEFMREANHPYNIAFETLFVEAQTALADGLYEDADALLQTITSTLADGDFTRQPFSDAYAIARDVARRGGEVQRIQFDGDSAVVAAIFEWPQVETVTYERQPGGWEIAPPE